MKNEDMVCKNVTGQNSETKDDLLKNFESHYSCPICLDIADDAVECTNCFKIYCGECTEGINACPSCRCTPSAWQPSRNARQFIGNLKTDCPNDGCKEKPTRSNLQVHLEKCEWSLIACSSDGCDKRIKQSGMVEHLLQCGHCLIKCSSKGCFELVKRKDVEDHKDRCLFTNINCMNCNEMFVRKNESTHLNICKEKIINCMFCGFSDTRMNVMLHSVRVHYEKVAHPFGEMLESIRVHRSVSNHYPSYLPP
ncbi:TNF receptor-associated factor 6-like [Clytia hemisphaerica]